MATSDPDSLIAKADKLTTLSLTRWNADWRNATALYEQAANAYRLAKKHDKAKDAFEKASKGQEMLSSPWDAAKHMESAAALAKELGNWSQVSDFSKHASELYIECGRSQAASDALAKGARALEEASPDEAIKLYTDACAVLEEDGKEQMAFDLYRAATSIYIRLEKYADAATFLSKLALAADKCAATHTQCKAYLGAIIVYLYAHDFHLAERFHNDCCQVETYLNSDQSHAANKLLSAYADGDVEEIKRVAQSGIINNLEHMIIKLARKLPTGDVTAFERGASSAQEEQFDEDNLT
ncbi:gamma-soluble NSF attachment protein-like [Andrographis paniculata]|uniref:gamma-soluble NSF attachment protein-like n=1 Tax=Andrographis paniculata TaxID=175694 RepID=UPI0021E9A305|nr:gamma-soluble NSF attachment protein-like [Andrographis paniculata]